jgi:hypothetical protein
MPVLLVLGGLILAGFFAVALVVLLLAPQLPNVER